MKRSVLIKLTLILAALLPTTLFSPYARAQSDTREARKFDEFDDIQLSDLKARLDNFATMLQNEPGTKGFVITYRSHRDLPGLSSRLLKPVREYMVNTRGLPSDRLVTVDGGEASCLTYELWIVPVGKAPKPRAGAYSRHFIDTETAWKFDEYFQPSLWDYTEDDEYARDSLEAYAEALRKQPRSQAYILAYAQSHPERRQDPPGAAAMMLKSVRTELIKKYGVTPSRIKLMDGGYRKRRQIELWVVPRGEHPPIATPNAFPKRRG